MYKTDHTVDKASYNKVLEAESQLSCPNSQVQAGTCYNQLKHSFERLQRKLTLLM